jgi:lycopene cyclase domain-containing protein
MVINGKWITKNKVWLSFFITWIALNVFSIPVELISLKWGIWGFDCYIHKLLQCIYGINLFTHPFGAPVEEYMFYFGATPFCLMVYIYYFRLIKGNKEKEEKVRDIVSLLGHLAWLCIGMPFVPCLKYMSYKMRDKKVVSWAAVWLATGVFYITMVFTEAYSVSFKHWVYDKCHILTITLFKIPIEEFILYYLLGPIFVVFLFHFTQLQLEEKSQGLRKNQTRDGGKQLQ